MPEGAGQEHRDRGVVRPALIAQRDVGRKRHLRNVEFLVFQIAHEQLVRLNHMIRDGAALDFHNAIPDGTYTIVFSGCDRDWNVRHVSSCASLTRPSICFAKQSFIRWIAWSSPATAALCLPEPLRRRRDLGNEVAHQRLVRQRLHRHLAPARPPPPQPRTRAAPPPPPPPVGGGGRGGGSPCAGGAETRSIRPSRQ